MTAFIHQVGTFIRERLELRGKMDEPTLRKYRTVFGIHVRVSDQRVYSQVCFQSAAEIIAIVGFIIHATFLSGELYRHRYPSFTANLISAICYLFLVLGINANIRWAHWPYFFVNVSYFSDRSIHIEKIQPIALLLQVVNLIRSHLDASPHQNDKEANEHHLMNLVVLIVFIGFLVLLHVYCLIIVYRSYKFMLDYLGKESQFGIGEEMDVIRTANDIESNEQDNLK